ncbi:hypothetical protein Daesc_009759 [Daldinia eschscholtzii]|uniref:2-(3-amino-3-carboxypropyl)histidine synthase subunit 2 n=1 Tax=Daldinia eschscholtzii TaxID=292717 RepID=A0AAX6MAJ7_9PEZI
MTSELSAPPILSTPAEHTFTEDPTPSSAISQAKRPHRPDHELYEVYEIARTASEIQQNGWKRIALQFPDAMLPDAPWVVNALDSELRKGQTEIRDQSQRLYILADTSYSACCVDEIAAEHANADGVALDYDAVSEAFEKEFPDKAEKVILMADVMFQEHIGPISKVLKERGYTDVVATEILRDPTGTIPNRKLITSDASVKLNEYHLFHISTPPTSLLLTLSSRLSSLRIYSTPSSPYTTTSEIPDPSATPGLLRRRYALVIRFATASIIGILVNTLSVKNYMSTISTLRSQIAAAGKKSYTIVVGKLNAAKLANFAEVDGWVVVGCWESGLVEQEGLWKPVITPFELRLALQGDESRVWTGEWWGGIEGVTISTNIDGSDEKSIGQEDTVKSVLEEIEGGVDDEESEPPEFDLRTGKLVSHSRPMRVSMRSAPRSAPEIDVAGISSSGGTTSSAVAKRTVGDIALVNGVASPGAEYLRSQRTWQGLGTDFGTGDEVEEGEESTLVEEGRSGVARGYTVGQDELRT